MSASEQDSIADDLCWDESFSRSLDILAQMATSAMAEHHTDKTQELETTISFYQQS